MLSLLVKRGGRVVDSSPMYGRAEGVVGELAAQSHLLDSLFMATKVWTRGKEAGIAMMQRSMARFRKIDLMQVHNLVDVETHMSSLREWKTTGRIRYTGITHSQARGFYEVERTMRSEKPDFVQINYSLMEPEAAQRILPLAQELRMAVTCVIPATSKPQHMEDNLAAGAGRLPDAKMRRRMLQLVSSL